MYLFANFNSDDKILPFILYMKNYIKIDNFKKLDERTVLLKDNIFYEKIDFKTFMGNLELNVVNDEKHIIDFLNDGKFKESINPIKDVWYEINDDFCIKKCTNGQDTVGFIFIRKRI